MINLPHSSVRREFQTAQLQRLGLEFELVEAVSSASFSESKQAEAQYQTLANTWQRPMRKTEVACFLSHQKAWQRVYDEKQPCLIIEDDALFSHKMPQLLASLKSLSDIDLVTLEVRSRKKIVSKKQYELCCESHLLELFQDRTGAAAYVLWPSGAEELLVKAALGQIGLADAFISSSYQLRAFQLEPAAVIQLDQCTQYHVKNEACQRQTLAAQSTITPHETLHPDANNMVSTLGFKIKRLAAQLSMGVRQLSVLYKSQRRFVRLNPDDF